MSYSFLVDPVGDALLFRFNSNERESYGETVAEETRILHYNELGRLYAVTFLYLSEGFDLERDLEYLPLELKEPFLDFLKRKWLVVPKWEAEKATA